MANNMVTVKVTGAKETRDALNNLKDAARVRTITAALKAGAQPIIDAARQNAHSADVARGVTIINTIKDREGEVRMEVGLPGGQKPWFHGLFDEFGTGPRVQSSTGRFTGAHPARPWLRPAFDSSEGAAQDAIGAVIQKRLEYYARRSARGL